MRALFLALGIGLCIPVHAQQAADTVAPEGAGAGALQVPSRLEGAQASKDAGRPVEAENWMIAAAHPLAVEAGAKVLRAGGTAADAMVAVQGCWGWWSRKARAWGAARSLSGMTGRAARSPRSTGAKPHRWMRRQPFFRMRRASRWSFSTQWWAGVQWARRARPRY